MALLTAVALEAVAQPDVVWSLDVAAVFENREGDDCYSPPQTIFQTRLAPEIGISFLDGHSVMGGVAWTQPCNRDCDDYDITPTIYYQYLSPHWRLFLGMFPRTKLIEPMHTVEWSDLKAYNEPNIRGAMMQYVHSHGFLELLIDWRSIQSETRREAFNANLSARWNPCGALLLGGRFHINHLAKSSTGCDEQSVNDDVMLNPYIGANLAGSTALDSLVVTAGAVVQLERDRGDGNGWHTPAGLLVDVVAEWRWIGLKETLFAGKNLYPLYDKYGDLLNMGDPSYQAKFYSRTNVYAYIFRNQFMNLEAGLDFHYTPEAFNFWQKVVLRVYIDHRSWKDKRATCPRDEYLRNIY